MTLMMNPELFSITQSKDMGIWPPSELVGHGVWPYIKRLRKDKIKILDVGCIKGETAMHLLELDVFEKIEMIYCEQSKNLLPVGYTEVLLKNIDDEPRITTDHSDGPFDVVHVHHSLSDLDKELEIAYNKLSPNGIFCGSEHSSIPVKEALSSFRRKCRIGVPIQVSYNSWFWYKR